jgi:transcriptional regulator with XRE-family HTH domain
MILDMKTYVEKLKTALESRGIRVAELARRVGMHPNRVTRWRDGQGDGYPRANEAYLIAKALDIPLEWFLDGSEGPPPPATASERGIVLELIDALGDREAARLLVEGVKRMRDEARATKEEGERAREESRTGEPLGESEVRENGTIGSEQ